MANRIPLIVKGAPTNQIQELPTNDRLLLSGHLEFDSNAAACGDIISSGGNDGVFGLFCSTSVSNSSKITVVGRNNANNGNVTIADFIVGGSNTPELKCFGDITAFASSDATLKENITPISNAIDKVLSISGNTFTWNEKSIYNGEEGTGIIAQEIEALGLPGLTTTRENGTKAVRYDRLVPLLIEAIKELSNKVESLEK
jgi:hypothetical protein